MAMHQPPLFSPLLSTRAAADLVGRDRVTIVRWVHQGRLKPAMTCGCGAYFFDPAEVGRAGAARWKGKHTRPRSAAAA